MKLANKVILKNNIYEASKRLTTLHIFGIILIIRRGKSFTESCHHDLSFVISNRKFKEPGNSMHSRVCTYALLLGNLQCFLQCFGSPCLTSAIDFSCASPGPLSFHPLSMKQWNLQDAQKQCEHPTAVVLHMSCTSLPNTTASDSCQIIQLLANQDYSATAHPHS